MPKLDVVFWTVFLDGGKPCQTLSGLRQVWRPTNVRFLDRSWSRFSVADNVGSNPIIAGSACSIAGSIADNSGLNASQLQIIPVGKWRRLQVCRVSIAGRYSCPIASGVIEGVCCPVVKDRMERAGMHWTLPGAQALLHLRCVALNDEWEPFMNHYIQHETTRLYANCPVQPQRARLHLVA